MRDGGLVERIDKDRQRRRDDEKAREAAGSAALLLPLALALSRPVARLDAAEAQR